MPNRFCGGANPSGVFFAGIIYGALAQGVYLMELFESAYASVRHIGARRVLIRCLMFSIINNMSYEKCAYFVHGGFLHDFMLRQESGI